MNFLNRISIKNKVKPAEIREVCDNLFKLTTKTPVYTGVTPEGIAYFDTKPTNNSNNNTIEHYPNPDNLSTNIDSKSSSFESKRGVTLLLAHGYAMGAGMWVSNLDELMKIPGVERVVMFDWRGMGSSDRDGNNRWVQGRHWSSIFEPSLVQSDSPTSLNNLINKLSDSNIIQTIKNYYTTPHTTPSDAVDYFLNPLPKLYKHLNFGEQPTILVGHSLGGYLSSCFALKHPELVSTLVLASPVGVSQGVSHGVLEDGSLNILESHGFDVKSITNIINNQSIGVQKQWMEEINSMCKFLGVKTPKLITPDHTMIKKIPQIFRTTFIKILFVGWQLNFTHKSILKMLPTIITEKSAESLSLRIFGNKRMSEDGKQTLQKYMFQLLHVDSCGESALNSLLTFTYSLHETLHITNRDIIQQKSATLKKHQSINIYSPYNTTLNSDSESLSTNSNINEETHSQTSHTLNTDSKNPEQHSSSPEPKDPSKYTLFPSVFARIPLSPLMNQLQMPLHMIYGSHDWLYQTGTVETVESLRTHRINYTKNNNLNLQQEHYTSGPSMATLTVLPDAGHHLYSNNPTAFIETVSQAVKLYRETEYDSYNPNHVKNYLANLDNLVKIEVMDENMTLEKKQWKICGNSNKNSKCPIKRQFRQKIRNLRNNPIHSTFSLLLKSRNYVSKKPTLKCKYASFIFGDDYLEKKTSKDLLQLHYMNKK